MRQNISKPIKYDRHGQRRMKWRKISKEEVELTIKNSDKTELAEKGRKNAFKSIGKRLIKVTFREFPEEILVISVVDKSGG